MANTVLPDYARFLFDPMRYKILYGGRGGAKSWSVAFALTVMGAQRPMRILCAREEQDSMKDSVMALIKGMIESNGLSHHYEFGQSYIRGVNGTEFGFVGLKHNPAGIKGWEGADICWVEEAALVSQESWKYLIPTIRKPGSEIWLTFNPDLDTDYTYKRFINNPPTNSIVKKVFWYDNPFVSQETLNEMEDCKRLDYDEYLNVWEGYCKQSVSGAVYAGEIRKAIQDQRITKVPYTPGIPVNTFWDIGFSDCTAIWFVQYVGFAMHVIDYYQNQMQPSEHYFKELQHRKYYYGVAYLPHDAYAKNISNGGKSFADRMEKAGYEVDRAKSAKKAERKIVQIQSVRDIFPNCWFDEVKTKHGIEALRRYKYKINSTTGQYSRDPDHDANSHGADAFAQLAIRLKKTKTRPEGIQSYSSEFSL